MYTNLKCVSTVNCTLIAETRKKVGRYVIKTYLKVITGPKVKQKMVLSIQMALIS